jgi:hypothetical protein
METDLIPPDSELDEDIIDLMRLVFRAEGHERASAAQLLQHPLIISGELQRTYTNVHFS